MNGYPLFSRPILGERLAAMLRPVRETTTTPVSSSVERAQMCPGLRWVNYAFCYENGKKSVIKD